MMIIMNKEKFNKYCREFSDYKIKPLKNGLFIMNESSGWDEYNPYDDLNQMADVVDKLAKQWRDDENIFHALCEAKDSIEVHGLLKAMRDFIVSTKEE